MKKAKTNLWKDEKGEIKTFFDLKSEIEEELNAELPITDDVIYQMIVERMVQNNGTLTIIEDEELKWCKDFCVYQGPSRYLTPIELAESIRDIYCDIKGRYNVEYLREMLNEGGEEEKGLLERLNVFVEPDILIKVPGWCKIGAEIEWKSPLNGEWRKRKITSYGYNGFFHKGISSKTVKLLRFTEFSEYGKTIKEVLDEKQKD